MQYAYIKEQKKQYNSTYHMVAKSMLVNWYPRSTSLLIVIAGSLLVEGDGDDAVGEEVCATGGASGDLVVGDGVVLVGKLEAPSIC